MTKSLAIVLRWWWSKFIWEILFPSKPTLLLYSPWFTRVLQVWWRGGDNAHLPWHWQPMFTTHPLLPILENIFRHKALLDKHRFDIHTIFKFCHFCNTQVTSVELNRLKIHISFSILICFIKKVALISVIWKGNKQDCCNDNVQFKQLISRPCPTAKSLKIHICKSFSKWLWTRKLNKQSQTSLTRPRSWLLCSRALLRVIYKGVFASHDEHMLQK